MRDQFAPAFAKALSGAIRQLNKLGITPVINSGFRTPGDQARMRGGASGSNPAARLSLHQAGYAVDISPLSPQFATIVQIMNGSGLKWGGTFVTQPDPPHFDQNPFGMRGTPEYYNRLFSAASFDFMIYQYCGSDQ
jgi:hypothetical protein